MSTAVQTLLKYEHLTDSFVVLQKLFCLLKAFAWHASFSLSFFHYRIKKKTDCYFVRDEMVIQIWRASHEQKKTINNNSSVNGSLGIWIFLFILSCFLLFKEWLRLVRITWNELEHDVSKVTELKVNRIFWNCSKYLLSQLFS